MPTINSWGSEDPAEVAKGGTGFNNAGTAYGVLAAGTSGTSAFQNIGTGAAGEVLKSNGAGVLPSFQAAGGGGFTSVVTQVFTASGTYTPTAGMSRCIIEVVGGGGGGGSGATTGSGNISVAGGGGGGEYARGVFTSTTIGVSQSVTIGGAGTAGTAGGAGGAGGTSSVGSTIISAVGGSGGSASATGGVAVVASGVAGGTGGTGGDFRVAGGVGNYGMGAVVGVNSSTIGGNGGSSYFGGGGLANAYGAGSAGQNYGSGGGGGCTNGGASQAGGAGAAGIVVITEYII